MANWPSTRAQIDRGIPLLLDQLIVELGHESSQTRAIRQTAIEHGEALFVRVFTVSQVVHDYGNVCQSVTDLALEQTVSISTDDFRTLIAASTTPSRAPSSRHAPATAQRRGPIT